MSNGEFQDFLGFFLKKTIKSFFMRLFQLTTRFAMAAAAGLMIFTSCVKTENSSDALTGGQEVKSLKSNMANEWMNLSFELTKKTPGFTSPVAARTYAYLSLGMYEVLVPGMVGYSSMQGKFQGFNRGSMKNPRTYGEISWNASLNEAMYQMSKRFYQNSTPSAIAEIEKLYNKNLAEFSSSMSAEVLDHSRQYGNDQAKALLAYAETDQQSEAYLNNYPSGYLLPKGEGIWSPSVNPHKRPLQPYWGNVRTFARHSPAGLEMVSPPEFSEETSSLLYAYALEVRNKVENVTRQDEVLVNFWNDDQEGTITPAGHMLAIMNQINVVQDRDLGSAVFGYMKLATTMHDATVAAWKTKYTYYTMRPETYIRQYIDGQFLSLSNATATPEYSSGQAAVVSAAVEVLGSVFGYSYAFTDRTYEDRKDIDGSPRSYPSFQDLADEVLNANLLGGIHYRFSLEAGQKQGIEIAKDFNAIR